MNEPRKKNGASIQGMEFLLKTHAVSMLELNTIVSQIDLLEARMTRLLGSTMLIYGFGNEMEVSDAAGYNWVAFRDIMSTHMIICILSEKLMSQYPDINFDV